MYLQEHGHKGRHKIQDMWSSIKYQVVRAPQEEGGVYSITPRDDLRKVRNVYCSLLKGRVQGDAPVGVFLEQRLECPELPLQEEDVDLVRMIAGSPTASSRECVISSLPVYNRAQSPGGLLDLATSGPVGVSAESEVVDSCPAPVSVLGVGRQLEVGETVKINRASNGRPPL